MQLSATLLFDYPSVSSVSSHVTVELASVNDCSSLATVPTIVTTQLCAGEGPPVLVTSAADNIAVVSYNRPQKNNAFDAAISGALVAVFAILKEDATKHATIVTGRGAYFCTAAKFDEMLRPARPMELHEPITTGS